MARRRKRSRRRPKPSVTKAIAAGVALDGLLKATGNTTNIPLASGIRAGIEQSLVSANLSFGNENTRDIVSGLVGALAIAKGGSIVGKHLGHPSFFGIRL